MIKNLLLDVDGTLLDFNAAAEASLRTLFAGRGYEWRETVFPLYEKINQGLWEQYEKGLLPREKVLVNRFNMLFEQLSIDEKGETFEKDFRDELSEHAILMEGAIEVLDYLKPKYGLYVVTNGIAETQRKRMAASGLDRYMIKSFVSEKIGSQKPQKEFFDYCFAHIEDCDPEELLLIGDSLSADILGANNAGIRSIWLNTKGAPNPGPACPDQEIRSLLELKTLL